jgi:hypothetical protein
MLVNNNFEDTLPQNKSQRQNTEAIGDVIPNEVEIENRESEEKRRKRVKCEEFNVKRNK